VERPDQKETGNPTGIIDSRADGANGGGGGRSSCDGRITKAHVLEAGVVFLLLLPFYMGFLRTDGYLHRFGFFYLTLISAYIIFLSPHRSSDPADRRSLHEVPMVTGLALFFEWGILPLGATGKLLGWSLLGLTAIYILFISARRHGDSWEDWGMGDPGKFIRYLWAGEHRHQIWAGILAANLVLFAACFLAQDLVFGILRGVLRRSFGIRLNPPFPVLFLGLIGLVLVNLFLVVVIRYDNLRRAGRIVGLYLLGLSALIAGAGYVYIYLVNGGYVTLDPQRGLIGMGAYVFWGTLQELLFLSYFNTRIRRGFTNPLLSALLTAIIFSIFHLTAYTLMFLCFLVGIIWALIFQAAPNLFLLGVSHGLSGGFASAFKVHGMTLIKIKGSVGPFNM
jgi:hypothetical protein